MEICRDDTWGTVCHGGWGNTDARVVCRQLGFNPHGITSLCMLIWFVPSILISVTGAVPILSAFYGRGTGPNVRCIGNETRLMDCPSGAVSGCRHNHDAGVLCNMQRGKI